MRSQVVYGLALGIALSSFNVTNVEAAKKYYPPGFTPPTDQKLIPTPGSQPAAQPQVIIQQIPGSRQVIIKTVPVPITVEKVITQPVKPRDPLLTLIDEHRFYDALRLVETRLKKSPNNTALLITRGKILREQRNYPQSLAQFQSILEKSHYHPTQAEALNGLGWTYYQSALRERQIGETVDFEKNLKLAETSFRQAVQFKSDLYYAWAGLGSALLAGGQIVEAEQSINKAMHFAPESLESQLAKAELLLAQGKSEDALQILYGIKKTTTHDPGVFLLLARGSLDIGKIDDAIINLKQLLELVPDHTEALKLLSQSYERKMKPEDAEDVLEKAIAINPADGNSVDSLLKIYEKRGENERSILLLKTLLKDRPGQLDYGNRLMNRLISQTRWDEAYQDGASLMLANLDKSGNSDALRPQLQEAVYYFSRSVYEKKRGLLDQTELLNEPAVQQAKLFSLKHLQSLATKNTQNSHSGLMDQLNVLLLDPLAAIPPLPMSLRPDEKDLPLALRIAFLQGNQQVHSQLLEQAKQSANWQAIATQLLDIGDDEGAMAIVEHIISEHTPAASGDASALTDSANLLKQQILASQKNRQDHLAALMMLPRKISDFYWQRAAAEALKAGNGDWKTHALIGDALEKRKEPSLALLHQKLAAQYAPDAKEKSYWERRANKTARLLTRYKGMFQ